MTERTSPALNAETTPGRAKRGWFRFQFGLRSLLVITLLIGSAAGLLSRWIARANRQREIVSKLRDAGCRVQWDNGLARGETIGWGNAEGNYFWQKVDFWHNVTQIVNFDSGPDAPETVRMIAELPCLQKIEFLLDYQEDAKIPPLPQLACRNQLRLLKILNAPLRLGDLERIGECQSLASLEIRVDRRSSLELASLNRLEQLLSLRIEGPVEDKPVAAWDRITRLEVLHLADTQAVSGESLAELVRRNPGLRRVELGNPYCTPELCEALSQCHSLTQLSIPWAQIDDEGLTKLRKLRQLGWLDISYTRVRGTAFDGAESFSGLHQLRAAGSIIDDQGAFLVGRLPKLRAVDLSHTKITDEACKHLSRYDLVTLNLARNSITDFGINALHCERLAKLNLQDTEVSARAFASASQWPNLERLILGKPVNSEADVERVLEIPTLTKLYANGEFSPEFYQRYSKRFPRAPATEWSE
jgi:hypothetical protein